LKVEGVVSLIIPDKRYCFDYFCPITTTGELIDAYIQKRKRPSAGKVFDHFSSAALRNKKIAWDVNEVGSLDLVHKFNEAAQAMNQAMESDSYIDVHSWRFTPKSFNHLIKDLVELGLISLDIVASFQTEGCEFYISLAPLKTPKKSNWEYSRLDSLLDRIKEC
jgi:hypothetical protein